MVVGWTFCFLGVALRQLNAVGKGLEELEGLGRGVVDSSGLEWESELVLMFDFEELSRLW
jgi:hypothetical protein